MCRGHLVNKVPVWTLHGMAGVPEVADSDTLKMEGHRAPQPCLCCGRHLEPWDTQLPES